MGARSDEQVSSLEAYIYEEPQDNLYPHHDVPLPVYPLCVAWFNFTPGSGSSGGGRGNFAAVGTFAPYIEVWDLDVLDALEPHIVLGAAAAAAMAEEQFTSHAAEALAASEKQKNGNQTRADKGSKKKKKKTLGAGGDDGSSAPQGHTDAVMCLAWNALQPNCLASGSADNTVRLWDLEGSCDGSLSALTHHRDKVQALRSGTRPRHLPSSPPALTAALAPSTCAPPMARCANGPSPPTPKRSAGVGRHDFHRVERGRHREVLRCAHGVQRRRRLEAALVTPGAQGRVPASTFARRRPACSPRRVKISCSSCGQSAQLDRPRSRR